MLMVRPRGMWGQGRAAPLLASAPTSLHLAPGTWHLPCAPRHHPCRPARCPPAHRWRWRRSRAAWRWSSACRCVAWCGAPGGSCAAACSERGAQAQALCEGGGPAPASAQPPASPICILIPLSSTLLHSPVNGRGQHRAAQGNGRRRLRRSGFGGRLRVVLGRGWLGAGGWGMGAHERTSGCAMLRSPTCLAVACTHPPSCRCSRAWCWSSTSAARWGEGRGGLGLEQGRCGGWGRAAPGLGTCPAAWDPPSSRMLYCLARPASTALRPPALPPPLLQFPVDRGGMSQEDLDNLEFEVREVQRL